MNGPRRRIRQAGLTLIETMIAMVIGLLIVAGIGEVFMAGRASYNVQQRLGDLQDNGRFALMFLERDIRHAAYPKTNETMDVFSTASAKPLTMDGGGNKSDRISVSYEKTPTLSNDCLGQSVVGDLIVNTYFVDVSKTRADGQLYGRLMCRGNGNAQSQPLVDGIENLQVLYGEDTDSEGAAGHGYPNRYVRADEVADWSRVVAVRVAVLASSIDTVIGDDPADRRRFRLLDAPAMDALPSRVRAQVFTTTVMIRNRTP
ncbi:MAG: PilW family protein [Stenotrophobium sp.]